jgi:hypothetical protein
MWTLIGAFTLNNVTRAPVAVSTPLMRTTGNGFNIDGPGAAAGCGTSLDEGGAATVGAAETSKTGAGVAGGVGVGVAVEVGAGVGVGVGVGVAAGAGAAITVAVGSERRSADPASLATLRRTRSTRPRSDDVTRYSAAVAPAITEQGPLARAQRNHVHVTVGGGSPTQVALAVSTVPT